MGSILIAFMLLMSFYFSEGSVAISWILFVVIGSESMKKMGVSTPSLLLLYYSQAYFKN